MLFLSESGRLRSGWAYAAVLPLVALNVGGWSLKYAFKLPIYLDTIGTPLAVSFGGLLPGVLVGALSNGTFMALTNQPGHWPFALVNMASALTTWLFIRYTPLNRFEHYLGLLVALIVVNSLLGAYFATVLFGGLMGGPNDIIVKSLFLTGESIPTSAFVGRLIINLVDKGIAVMVLVAVRQLVTQYVRRSGDRLS